MPPRSLPGVLLLCLILWLCGVLPAARAATHSAAVADPLAAASAEPAKDAHTAGPAAFSLQIDAPPALAQGLLRHLELQRYKAIDDLDATELARLLDMADVQARELLATWGHFSPGLRWSTREGESGGTRWQVRLQVDAGPLAHIQEVRWTFQGHVQDSERHAAQRRALQQQWRLPAGHGFTQEAWSAAKTAALQQLTSEHYPLGHWVRTEARVDPQTAQVVLELVLDSGPEVFLGPITIEGQQRYSLEQARRLANVPTGRSYRQADLLEAQQRLVLSGFYDAVFVSLDTTGPPDAMPVRIELKETLRQRWQLGLGVRSDTGPRMTLEHTQQRVPGLDWRAITRLSADRLLQNASVDLLAPPDDSLWRWNLSGKVEHQQFTDYAVTSQRLRAGRAQLGERTDRSYYTQYDMASHTGALSGIQESVSAHYAWTWRRFDSMPFPSQGWGLGLEVGAGLTLGSERVPYSRSHAKALWLLPLGSAGRRLSLRAELGAVSTRQSDNIPSTQLFLAGGDLSVRGYAPGSIGVTNASGTVVAGRYLNTASVEWQWPIQASGRRSDWDGLLFVDTGAVANTPQTLRPRVGAGVGARWRSPVGPLEIDLAQARDSGRWRLHMNVGFRF